MRIIAKSSLRRPHSAGATLRSGTPRRSGPGTWFALAWLTVAGCVGTLPLSQVRRAEAALVVAREMGAYRCAGRELALAQANLEFAKAEEVHGELRRALFHLEEAELHAAAAARLSLEAGCGELAPERTNDVVLRHVPGDRDGDGVLDQVDLCPDEPEDQDGYLDEDGCADPDNDNDGVADVLDGCPDDPEDPDTFEDGDGCAEADNDQDAIPDLRDACPQVSASESINGCPKAVYPKVHVEAERLRLSQGIDFDAKQPRIARVSLPVLATVAQVLQDMPTLVLEIQAHTDSRGDAAANQVLSQTRAEAVRQVLIDHGVRPERLRAVGYGETRPVESNRTSSGRALNRRVEFLRSGP